MKVLSPQEHNTASMLCGLLIRNSREQRARIMRHTLAMLDRVTDQEAERIDDLLLVAESLPPGEHRKCAQDEAFAEITRVMGIQNQENN